MVPPVEPPPRRRPGILVTILLVLCAIPALLMTACGASAFVAALTSGPDSLWLAALGLACTAAGVCALYALFRMSRGD